MSKIIGTKSIDKPTSEVTGRENIAITFAWSISGLASLTAILVWARMLDWHLSFQAYKLFPLLGLLAFSIMWGHYVATFVRRRLSVRPNILSDYFKSTSLIVLALLFLHPGLLILQRFRDGYGFPPHSYESYVAPGLGWVTLLGSASWLAFIAFEFRGFYSKRAWWKYVPMAGDIAMLAIVYHGLRIGSNLQMGWYRGVWLGYGIVLIIILGNKYYLKFLNRHLKSSNI